MSMKCRRCHSAIAVDAVAHLLPVRASGYQVSNDYTQSAIVCENCIEPEEKGFNEHGYVYVPKPKPEATLSPSQMKLLEHVDMGRVYRRPRRVYLSDPDTGTNRAITERAYQLLKLGVAQWEPVPVAEQVPDGPNAWMRPSDEGRRFLKLARAVQV